MIFNITASLLQFWDLLCSIVPDDFASILLSSLFGSGVGALWGAHAAHNLARNNENKKSIISEIGAINTAITTIYMICEELISLKSQCVKPMAENYKRDQLLAKGNMSTSIKTELNAFFVPSAPIDLYMKLAFKKISLNAKCLKLSILLLQSINLLNKSISIRNEMIGEFKIIEKEELLQKYFGIKDRTGTSDNRFEHIVDTLFNANDDCIYYSSVLSTRLNEYGNIVKSNYERKFKSKLPNIVQTDFSSIKDKTIIPSDEKYKELML